jgi:plasmid stabilization system protein ParE
MNKFQFTPQASNDLFEIWGYIANDSPRAADRAEAAILAACETLADAPLAGRVREDLTALRVRFWLVQPYRTYWIVYDCQTAPIRILRILQASREIPPIL